MKKINIAVGTDLNVTISQLNNEKMNKVVFNEDDLLFPNWIYEALPYPLNLIPKVIDHPVKRDLALISALGIEGAILKNYKVQHGEDLEGCQLYLYIIAKAAQGKGFLRKLRKMGEKYHKHFLELYKKEYKEYEIKLKKYLSSKEKEKLEEPEKPARNFLFVSADNTKSALVVELSENNGMGCIFEPEADTLTTANKSDFGGFSDVLRKGFHGESHSTNRQYLKAKDKPPIEIESVRITIIISSTIDQCKKLIPDFENGLFSRMSFKWIPNSKFASVYKESKPHLLDEALDEIADYFLDLGLENATRERDVYFQLTDDQKKVYEKFFIKLDEDFFEKYGDTLQANIKRAGLVFHRICMLLSYLRHSKVHENKVDEIVECDDIDFEIALNIIEKLLHNLEVVNTLYEKQSVHTKVSISSAENNTAKAQEYSKLKEAFALVEKGVSYGQAALQVYGKETKKGEIHKKYEKYISGQFQFPKPSQYKINVPETLKQAEVSIFENVRTSTPIAESGIPLLDLITSEGYCKEVEAIRTAPNEATKKQLKNNLITFTASGLFQGKRKNENLLKHSGFICLDVDEKQNQHILNFAELKEQFANIENVAFCAHSVGGRGYYLLLPIEEPDKHEKYYEAVVQAMSQLGIKCDVSCRDVARQRIISYDEKYFMATKAVLITNILHEERRLDFGSASSIDMDDSFSKLLKIIEASKIDITIDEPDWFNIANALANVYGERGRHKFHLLSQFHTRYNEIETDKKFDMSLKNKQKLTHNLATIFFIARKYGIHV